MVKTRRKNSAKVLSIFEIENIYKKKKTDKLDNILNFKLNKPKNEILEPLSPKGKQS